jgi:hypothetical protein
MESSAVAVLVGLVLGFLPAAIIAFLIVALIVAVVLVFALIWLIDQPLSAWFFAASLAFNAIVLVPLWVVAWLASVYQPEMWETVSIYVLWFTVAFCAPTVAFLVMWDRAKRKERN